MVIEASPNQQFIYAFYKGIDTPNSQATTDIDVWVRPVWEIDLNSLPRNTGQVFVWDDLFWRDRPFKDEIQSVLDIIEDCLGAESFRNSGYCYQLDTTKNLSRTISDLLQRHRFESASRKIALIDLVSTGPTPLDWSDILPILRDHYDLVVGFHHLSGRGISDTDLLMEDSFWRSYSYEMSLCDIVFLTSDSLLGIEHLSSFDERIPDIQNLTTALIETLRSMTDEMIRAVSSRPAWFAIASSRLPPNSKTSDLTAYQADIIREHFCNPDHSGAFDAASIGHPIETEKVILWPLRAQLPIARNQRHFEP